MRRIEMKMLDWGVGMMNIIISNNNQVVWHDYVWAWIAFVTTTTTTTISFWKMMIMKYCDCSSIIPSSNHHHHSPHQLSSSPLVPQSEIHHQLHHNDDDDDEYSYNSTTTTPTPSSFTSSSKSKTLEYSRKSGKFSLYYYNGTRQAVDDDLNITGKTKHDDDDDDDDFQHIDIIHNHIDIAAADYDDMSHRRRTYFQLAEKENWEAVLKLKTREMRWYKYQDLMVLDGNVVHLWTTDHVY